MSGTVLNTDFCMHFFISHSPYETGTNKPVSGQKKQIQRTFKEHVVRNLNSQNWDSYPDPSDPGLCVRLITVPAASYVSLEEFCI